MYTNKPQVHVEQGEQLKLTIKRLGINGEGIGYYEHSWSSCRVHFLLKKSLLKSLKI